MIWPEILYEKNAKNLQFYIFLYIFAKRAKGSSNLLNRFYDIKTNWFHIVFVIFVMSL